MRVVLRSNMQAAKRQIVNELQSRLEQAANAFREHLVNELNRGALPIQSDTQALAKSLFVQTPGGSDYAQRLGEAMSAYISGSSQWEEAVRQLVTPTAYSPEHFNDRVAQEEPLPTKPETAVAGVATMLAYGAWWEFGHQNVFTQRDEAARSWMEQTALTWARANFEDYFENLI